MKFHHILLIIVATLSIGHAENETITFKDSSLESNSLATIYEPLKQRTKALLASQDRFKLLPPLVNIPVVSEHFPVCITFWRKKAKEIAREELSKRLTASSDVLFPDNWKPMAGGYAWETYGKIWLMNETGALSTQKNKFGDKCVRIGKDIYFGSSRKCVLKTFFVSLDSADHKFLDKDIPRPYNHMPALVTPLRSNKIYFCWGSPFFNNSPIDLVRSVGKSFTPQPMRELRQRRTSSAE